MGDLWKDRIDEMRKEGEELKDKLKEGMPERWSPLKSLWETVSGFFSTMSENIWTGFKENVLSIFPNIFNYIQNDFLSITKAEWDKTWDDLSESLGIPRETISNLKGLYNSYGGMRGVATTTISLTLIIAVLKGFGEAISGDVYKELYSKFTPATPSPGDVMNAAFIAPEKISEVRRVCAENGLSDKDIDLMFLARYRLYDEGVTRILYLRDEIDENKMRERLRETGYTDTRINELIKTWEVIPSLSDIVRYMGKEVFEPDMINRFGLMEDYPKESEDWAKKQGLDKRWAKAEWIAHWIPPGLQTILEGFHRNKISWEDVEAFMRLVEIPPRFRELIRDIAYHPYTRVDVRRMHKIGVLDDEQLLRSYMDLGYDLEHAEGLSNFTKKYNLGAEQTLNKEQILSGYKIGSINKSTALVLLKELGYPDEIANYFLALAEYSEELEKQKDEIENIKIRYVNRYINEGEAKDKLNQLGLPQDEIYNYLLKWKSSAEGNDKLPSKTDLDKMYKAGVIDINNWREVMLILGYKSTHINWYEKLMTGK